MKSIWKRTEKEIWTSWKPRMDSCIHKTRNLDFSQFTYKEGAWISGNEEYLAILH